MRRVAIMLVAASVLGIIATATPASAASPAAKKITSCKKDKNLAANIQTAFNQYLTSDTSADKMKLIQDGTKLIAISDEGAAAAKAAGQTTSDKTTLAVAIVPTCDGKAAATFKYDLAVGQPKPVTVVPSTGIGLNFAGDAVLQKGVWLISGATICDLIGQNPNTPGLGDKCLAAL
jgi:hypothetical protein